MSAAPENRPHGVTTVEVWRDGALVDSLDVEPHAIHLTLGDEMYVDNEQRYGNGTIVLTIKREDQTA